MNTLRVGWPALAAAWLVATGPGGAAESGTGLELARQLNQAFVEVARKISPTVVVISVIEKPAAPSDDEDDSAFDSLPPGFWRRFHEQFRQPPQETRGEGSGIIIRPDGYILTNQHVVEDAESIEVRLQDGRRFHATVRGVDVPSDVAVIKIDAQGLPVATLADSSQIRVGEFAIAVGTPFSLDYTVTFGHVSATGRANVAPSLAGAAMDQDFIQTDALINPGNSGGPLVNIGGEVIGINTLIRGLHTGIGFAIPSNLAKEIADKLIADGKFTRPWLGIAIGAVRDNPDFQALTPGIADGVIVSRILPSGPAAKSQLKPSDVITAVDGEVVSTPQQLRTAIRRKTVGRPVTLTVFRNGKTLPIQLSPAEWTEPAATAVAAKSSAPAARAPVKLGLTVQVLTQELAERFGVEPADGVVVTTVEKGSLAARHDLKPGDIITAVNQQPVTTPKTFDDALKGADLSKGLLVNLISANIARFEILKDE